mmetsp:Transcript_3878/g.7568  ORF Transcript_3878/g.7568 Transcript_3878/m.7568 type:complete len:223 (+) Transcript_3878:545-1213(+)
MALSTQPTRIFSRICSPMALGSVCSPCLKEATVWPAGLGGRSASRCTGFFLRSWNSLMAPPTREPPFSSSTWMRPNAAFMDSCAGSPAYTPEQKGSMSRSNTSPPKLRRMNCSTLSSNSGIGCLMPMAPSPARIFPSGESSVKVGRLGRPSGVGRSCLSHQTKRGDSGSASARLGTWATSVVMRRMGSPGWKLLGPSSHIKPSSLVHVVMLPPILSRDSVTR